jgi:uncharacterized protein (TIGR02145 family)
MFANWSGGVSGTANPGIITVKKNLTITANFQYQPPQSGGETGKAYNAVTIGGKTYKAVTIGGKAWMTENLNIKTGGSQCYDKKESNCDKYGRLYTWNAAKKACPSGWHLPSREEWQSLVDIAGGSAASRINPGAMNILSITGGNSAAGKMLKAKSGWTGNFSNSDMAKDLKAHGEENLLKSLSSPEANLAINKGTDAYGFSALPGGMGSFDARGFNMVGCVGCWWTATEAGGGNVYHWSIMYAGDNAFENSTPLHRENTFSVRCVAD